MASANSMPNIDTNFWKNKRVFITGHTGFIGGWLFFWLHKLGADLTGYALAPNSNPNFYDIAGLKKIGKHYIADICNFQKLADAIAAAKPDIILHLAAQALVRPAFKDPVDTFATNVNGTIHLLEAARACPSLQSALIFTTDKVYENIEIESGYIENDRLGGYEPYGASKACAEIVVSSYWHSYFKNPLLPMATLRAGNVIGGGDWSEDRLVPDAVRAFGDNLPLVLRHPESIRPWQHVLEPCYAILRMIEHMHHKREQLFSLNIGPDAKDCLTVGQVSDMLVGEWNKQLSAAVKWKHTPDDKIYEAKLLMLNNTLARKKLNWQPRWDAKQTVRNTVAWYAAHRAGENMAEFTAAQIQTFIDGDHHG